MLEIDWKNKAECLWSLLDDIDTASDMFHPSDEKSYKAFYEYAMKKCVQRSKYMNSLDGHTLTAVEEEDYQSDLDRRYKLLDKFRKEQLQKTEALIQKAESCMTEEEKDNYIFKWMLVNQEIEMWIQINKQVTDKEFLDMCHVRGFDEIQARYLEGALDAVGLKPYSGVSL